MYRDWHTELEPASRPSDSAHPRRPDDRSLVPAPRADLERRARALEETLEQLVRLIEQQRPGMHASILLLDDNGLTLRHGAAPNLPDEYNRAVDGLHIGASAGSCGTAAFRGEQVVVRDIATDPLWADYRQLALPHGLRACWSTPIRDDEGRVLGTFAMYYDEPRVPTSDEQSLIDTATLLASSIIVRARIERALRDARAEADHANKAKSDFLAMMSHELRTPLNAIGGYARLMLDGIPTPVSAEHQGFLERVLKAQQHLLGLIDDVLTHAKLEAGRMSYRMANITVGELLEAIDSLVRPQLTGKDLNYDCAACDTAIVVRADREKTVQILLNILSNAVKFTPRGGRITIRTARPAPGRALIGIRDTGIGMTSTEVATVFEPFVQFDNSLTRQEKGTGLGMPISRELARGMGGELTVESEAGVGTEFLLTLAAREASS
jgi:two-component system cell cycle sensor histidine kinase PleC